LPAIFHVKDPEKNKIHDPEAPWLKPVLPERAFRKKLVDTVEVQPL